MTSVSPFRVPPNQLRELTCITFVLGRDELVTAATGTTSYKGVTYKTTSTYVTGLLTPGAAGALSLAPICCRSEYLGV